MKYVVTVNGEEHEVTLDGAVARTDGAELETQLAELEGTPVKLVTIEGRIHKVLVRRGEASAQYILELGGYRFEAEALDERTRAIRQLSGAAARPAGPTSLVAPMPGLVVRVLVAAGDSVRSGQGVVVIEAMKMENELRAQAAGVVRRVGVAPGSAVEKGAVLVEFDAAE